MDSEKGNRVFARGAQCAPPPWFLEPKKSLVWIGLIVFGLTFRPLSQALSQRIWDPNPKPSRPQTFLILERFFSVAASWSYSLRQWLFLIKHVGLGRNKPTRSYHPGGGQWPLFWLLPCCYRTRITSEDSYAAHNLGPQLQASWLGRVPSERRSLSLVRSHPSYFGCKGAWKVFSNLLPSRSKKKNFNRMQHRVREPKMWAFFLFFKLLSRHSHDKFT